MRTKLNKASPEDALSRLLEALGQELIDASDEEVMQAAKDLGMDPKMRGSAAFLGLKFPAKVQLSDFFDLDALRGLMVAPLRHDAPTLGIFEISTDSSTNGKNFPDE